MRAAALALLLGAAPAAAQEGGPDGPPPSPPTAPDSALLPPPRPEVADAPSAEEPRGRLIPPEEQAERLGASPAPEGPDEVGPPGSAAEAAPAEPSGPSLRERLAETPEELAACTAELDRLGVSYEEAEPIAEEGNPDCGIVNPVTVTALAPGVALDPPAEMRCAVALASARWLQGSVAPLAAKLGRGEVVAVGLGTAYLCRPRADGEDSEHAAGSALDVMGFRFAEGEPLAVEPRAGDGTLEEAFQRAVQAAACLDFATVLGPGSDEAHADHLHLDVKAREGGFRICQ